jgi:RNA polymerase sigma-70 factor, ECF subfamily
MMMSQTMSPPTEDVANKIAFEDVLIKTLPSLRQYAYALTRNRADADDLLQSAVSNALAARNSFTPGTNFKAWMSCILRNRFLSDTRRRRETVAVDDAPQELFARAASQDDNIALGELRRAMNRLPAGHRLALVMITVQGLSYEEASAELGVPVGTVKCRVFRARKQLHAWLMGDADTKRPALPKMTQVSRANSAAAKALVVPVVSQGDVAC